MFPVAKNEKNPPLELHVQMYERDRLFFMFVPLLDAREIAQYFSSVCFQWKCMVWR